MTVLCYHAIDPRWAAPISVHPETFAAHCGWLTRRRRVLPLDEVVGAARGGGGSARGAVAITFDDGFASVYDHAFPILARERIPATVFPVAGTLTTGGQPVDWVDRPPATGPPATLDRSQIREMHEAGIGFGSHGFAHEDLTRLGDLECERDLRESRLLLEEIVGAPIRFLAYPRGRHDERVRRAAERAGYTHAFALPERHEPVTRYSIPRVGVYGGNGLMTLRIKADPLYLPLRGRLGSVRVAAAGGSMAPGR